jgi:hypothetical protein
MRIGFPSVFYSADKPHAMNDEKSLVLAQAYRLAYEDYLRDSVGKWFSRIVHLAKPKRISVVARLGYELKIVPFTANEFFISDTCSPCPEKFEIMSINSKALFEASNMSAVSTKTNIEQTMFIKQLRTISLILSDSKKNLYPSPFLHNSNTLIKEIINCLYKLEAPPEVPPIIEPEAEVASHPERLSNHLFLFLQKNRADIANLESAKSIIISRCQEMIDGITSRYPITQQEYTSTEDFGWQIPKNDFTNPASITNSVESLIEGLKNEAKPEIDKIDKDSRVEIDRLEQTAKLKAKEIEHQYRTQIEYVKGEMDLVLRRLNASAEFLEQQIKLFSTEHKEAAAAYRKAQEKYNESIALDTYGTAETLLENTNRLKRKRNELKEKLDNNREELSAVRSQVTDEKTRYNKSIANIEENLNAKLKENDDKMQIAVDAVQEARKKGIDEKLVHATAIMREKKLLEEVINESIANKEENLEEKIVTSVPQFWHNETLIDLKVSSIENLRQKIIEMTDDALSSIEQTEKFLEEHLIRTSAVSVLTEMLIPFWYIELESGSTENPTTEAHIISPSEVISNRLEQKAKTICSLTFIPKLTATAAILNSVKEYPKLKTLARLNNQISELTVTDFLHDKHWIIQNRYISDKLHQELLKEAKKQSKRH